MKYKLAVLTCLLFAGLLHAQNPDTLWRHSRREFEKKDFHGSIQDLDQLIKLAPSFKYAYFNRGIAYLNLGNTEKACTDLKMAKMLGFKGNEKFVAMMCDPAVKIKELKKYFYKNETIYPETGYRPKYTRADTLRGALRPERTCYDVYFYDLTVRVIPKGKRIEGNNKISFHVTEPSKTIQIDLFSNYTIKSITWNNQSLSYRREFNAIFITFPHELEPGENQSIQIDYYGKPQIAINPPWEGGFDWSKDKNHNLWVGVACEQLGASSWWPNKDHLTDEPDSMKISMEVPHGYQAICNGNLRSEKDLPDGFDRFVWFVSYPINNYDVTFYMGKFAGFTDTLITGTDTIMLKYHVMPYNLDIAKEHFKQVKDVLSVYSDLFGPYPFKRDGYGLVESPYEGMENQTAIAYGNNYTRNKDHTYRNDKYDYIIVHESAHEWWGNAVTAGDMADIWIHEGFATYAENLFMERMFGKDEYMNELLNKSREITNFWPMVQDRDVNENSFAGNDVYTKGSMMLHCLRCTINNDTLFFKILKGFNLKYRYKSVNSNDFITFVNEFTGSDYTSFFKKYLYDTRLPILDYSFKQDGNDLILKYKWTEVDDGFKMPFGIETDNKESYRIEATTEWQEMSLPDTQWFNFYNIWKGYEGSKDNSFTYYWTRWLIK